MLGTRTSITFAATLLGLAGLVGSAAADEGLYWRETPSMYVPTPGFHPYHRVPVRRAWYDVGVSRGRIGADTISTANGRYFTSNTIHFGLGVMVDRHFYLGGDTDFGTIGGSQDNPFVGSGPEGRSSNGQTTSPSDLTLRGSTAAIRGVGGITSRAGSISGAAELAVGYRVDSTDAGGFVGSQTQQDTLVEARGKLALWLSPALTLNGSAGINLLDHRDVALGISLGIHASHLGSR